MKIRKEIRYKRTNKERDILRYMDIDRYMDKEREKHSEKRNRERKSGKRDIEISIEKEI